jgi:hypothetical protein
MAGAAVPKVFLRNDLPGRGQIGRNPNVLGENLLQPAKETTRNLRARGASNLQGKFTGGGAGIFFVFARVAL